MCLRISSVEPEPNPARPATVASNAIPAPVDANITYGTALPTPLKKLAAVDSCEALLYVLSHCPTDVFA